MAPENTSRLFDAPKRFDPKEVVAQIRAMPPAEQDKALAELSELLAAFKPRPEAGQAQAAVQEAKPAEAKAGVEMYTDAARAAAAPDGSWTVVDLEPDEPAAGQQGPTSHQTHGEYTFHVALACKVLSGMLDGAWLQLLPVLAPGRRCQPGLRRRCLILAPHPALPCARHSPGEHG
jgi:hypothetical protein